MDDCISRRQLLFAIVDLKRQLNKGIARRNIRQKDIIKLIETLPPVKAELGRHLDTRLLVEELRSVESRSKGPLLKRAADMIERLSGGTAERKTRADRIRGMSDPELAWELMEWRFDAFAKAKGDESVLPDNKAAILEWLQQQIYECRQFDGGESNA